MSEYLNRAAGEDEAGAFGPAARPTSVTVLGILNIVFGALGLICTPIMLLGTLASPPADMSNPILAAAQDPAFRTYNLVAAGLGVIVAVVLIVAGVGLLNLKPWGRTLSIGYAVYAIIACIAGLIFNYIYLVQPVLAASPDMSDPETAGAVGGAIGGAVGGACMGLIYPIVLLIFMTRPHVVDALRPR